MSTHDMNTQLCVCVRIKTSGNTTLQLVYSLRSGAFQNCSTQFVISRKTFQTGISGVTTKLDIFKNLLSDEFRGLNYLQNRI